MTRQRRGSRVVIESVPSDLYSIAPHKLMRDPTVKPGAKLAIQWLAGQDADWVVYAAQGAKDMGVKPHTFAQWLELAAQTRYLRRVPTGEHDTQGHPTFVYHVILDPAQQPVPENGSGHAAPMPKTGSGQCRKAADKKNKKEEHKDSLTRGEDTHPLAEPSTPASLFGAFWSVYPKKVAKQPAQKNWDRAIKAGADPQVIIAGAKTYAAAMEGKDRQYLKSPDGWLAAARWDDELPPAGQGGRAEAHGRWEVKPSLGTEFMPRLEPTWDTTGRRLAQ